MTATAEKSTGRIIGKGMGGFLNPPTHPEHSLSVEADLHRRPDDRSWLSLSSAAESVWLDDATREAAATALRTWQRPSVDAPEVRDWIRQVLGYFKNCYRNPDAPEGKQWDASGVIVDKHRAPLINTADHCGVHFIRKYYPEYTPHADDFAEAYWGKKN
jgi:hypothetical protein